MVPMSLSLFCFWFQARFSRKQAPGPNLGDREESPNPQGVKATNVYQGDRRQDIKGQQCGKGKEKCQFEGNKNDEEHVKVSQASKLYK